MALRVLIVDDSRDDAELTEHALRVAGLAVDCRSAARADALDAVLDGFAPDLVVCDLNLPGWSCAEALATVRGRVPHARVVLLTGAEPLPGERLPEADAVVIKDRLAPLVGLARALADAPRTPAPAAG